MSNVPWKQLQLSSCVCRSITVANMEGIYFQIVYHRLICIVLSIVDCYCIQNMLSITIILITDSNDPPHFIDYIYFPPTISVLNSVVVRLKHTTI